MAKHKSPGEIITKYREEAGITAYELGKRAGLDPDTVRRIETSGGHGISLDSWRRLCGALGVDPMEAAKPLAPLDLTVERRGVGRPKKISD